VTLVRQMLVSSAVAGSCFVWAFLDSAKFLITLGHFGGISPRHGAPDPTRAKPLYCPFAP
jgi:hypothetical protein